MSRALIAALVAVGGFCGATARYAVDLWLPTALLPTLTVNVVGSFALGLLLYESLYRGQWSQYLRLGAGTGFLSSFTTYSTFILDLLQTTPGVAVGYLILSYSLGFAAVILAKQPYTRYMEGTAQ